MIGVTGATLSSACFGFSESLGLMIFSRALAGALSGNVAVISSMLSEMTDETNQGKGKSVLEFSVGFGLSDLQAFRKSTDRTSDM